MLTPTLLVLAVFVFVPLGVAIVQSFYAWDLLTPPRFVGAANYVALATSGQLAQLVLRTAAFTALVVAGATTLGLAMAVLLNRPGFLVAIVRGAVLSAYLVSWVAVALLWMGLLDEQSGALAGAARLLGTSAPRLLTHPDYALATLAAVTVWKVAGYAMIIFLAALQDVPPSLLEAASLDGAGPLRRFWHVTLPVIRPAAIFVVLSSTIMAFQAFDAIRIMTQGGPVRSTTIFVYAIFEETFVNLRVGRASALAVILFAVLAALSALQWRLLSAKRAQP